MDSFVEHPSTRWLHMATIQVAENGPDLADILSDLDFGFRLEPAGASPSGYRWLELLVDARRGPCRCALTAHRLLCALQCIAGTGDLPGFRVIAGERWLDDPRAFSSVVPDAAAEGARDQSELDAA